MNQNLWNNILAFDFDRPHSEYSFSIRLAHENFWTEEFTEKAILEYKKFMYLAAISDKMVSPSEIIDKVWHEHLVFTKSYKEFGKILGKSVHHIPSTFQKGEFQKFQDAKVHTQTLYEKEFGQQPISIWKKTTMFDGLNLKKAKIKLRTKLLGIISFFILLFFPLFYYFSPIIRLMDDKTFLWGFLICGILVLLVMEWVNHVCMQKLMNRFDKDSFFYHLTPEELVYLKTRSYKNTVYATIHELLERGLLRINSDGTIKLLKFQEGLDKKERQVLEVLKSHKIIDFHKLIGILSSKKIVQNISNSMEAFVKYVHKSKRFHQIFLLNIFVYSFFLIFGFIRLKLGISHDEPIFLLIILLILFMIGIFMALSSMTQYGFSNAIKRFYKNWVLPTRTTSEQWKWNYYLVGSSVLAASLLPLIGPRKNNSSSACGAASCGASCGSSCGSGCGGCGS